MEPSFNLIAAKQRGGLRIGPTRGIAVKALSSTMGKVVASISCRSSIKPFMALSLALRQEALPSQRVWALLLVATAVQIKTNCFHKDMSLHILWMIMGVSAPASMKAASLLISITASDLLFQKEPIL